jgi:hypothetical protein
LGGLQMVRWGLEESSWRVGALKSLGRSLGFAFFAE